MKSFIFDSLAAATGVCTALVITPDDCWLTGLIDSVLIVKEDRWKVLAGWLTAHVE